MSSSLPPTLRFEAGEFRILDQTLLPHQEKEIALGTIPDVAHAIRRLAVRGAPAIGIAAAYGIVVAARSIPSDASAETCRGLLEAARETLSSTRPTAFNLVWALDRMAAVWRETPPTPVSVLRDRLLEEARAIHAEDRAACETMGRLGADLLCDGGTYLTHCNAGALATGGIGTALSVFHVAAREGMRLTVYADETRPLLQGARLTTWELSKSGLDVILICDSAAAGLILGGAIDAVFVGADRIAANGDVANKVGTLSVALAADRGGIPFYVVAPTSTIDPHTPSGEEIPIEERPPEEVTGIRGHPMSPPGIRTRNPAFDVTPAALVTAIITETGILHRSQESAG